MGGSRVPGPGSRVPGPGSWVPGELGGGWVGEWTHTHTREQICKQSAEALIRYMGGGFFHTWAEWGSEWVSENNE